MGLSMVLLLFGGLGLDYWRGLVLQRELVAVADSAALAGASGIDESVYRSTGELVLQTDRAAHLAGDAISWQDVDVIDVDVTVDPTLISVTLLAELDPLLLGVFSGDDDPFVVRASASASPVLVP